ncbi:hypothetical protein [Isoptericola aurantiacus]|uniref:hypothetical protein n=1 Tax=Isoptericola aurantiacus TaxID=3377839 RepID=UPI003839EE28
MVTIDEARAAKRTLRARLVDVRNVCGTGLACRGGDREWVVQVDVTSPGARRRIPATVDGVPVRVRVVGPIGSAPRSG